MATKKLTIEEQRAICTDALKKLNEAMTLRLEADELFRKCGVEMCSAYDPYEKGLIGAFHIFSGLKHLADVMEQQIYHPLDIFLKPKDHEIAIRYDRIQLFQIPDHSRKPYTYR